MPLGDVDGQSYSICYGSISTLIELEYGFAVYQYVFVAIQQGLAGDHFPAVSRLLHSKSQIQGRSEVCKCLRPQKCVFWILKSVRNGTDLHDAIWSPEACCVLAVIAFDVPQLRGQTSIY